MSDEQRAIIVAEARTFIGTRFHHQARVKGSGVDCVGLVVLSARAAGIEIEDQLDYGRRPDGTKFMEAVSAHCDRILLADILPADLMVFAWDADPKHIGIVSAISPSMLIHAYAEVRKVVETGIDNFWLARLRGCYRLKALT